jgi:hypothetical protein
LSLIGGDRNRGGRNDDARGIEEEAGDDGVGASGLDDLEDDMAAEGPDPVLAVYEIGGVANVQNGVSRGTNYGAIQAVTVEQGSKVDVGGAVEVRNTWARPRAPA